ncbi:MAG: HAD family hydrolase [Tissierellia bacterium]|jgi:Cof subfamily protein (haloacid dehalogenase superfamily)|nr:HAD family hydrolase [Tissierellia bacterium]
MIKLIVTDMDGTLLDDNKNLNHEFHEVYNELRNRDIKFAVASGRHYSEMHKYFRPQYKDMIYIAENGGQIVYEDKEIFTSTMDMNEIFKIAEDAMQLNDVDIILSGSQYLYLYNYKNKPLNEIRDFYFQFKIINHLSQIKEKVFKISIFNEKGSDYNTHKFIYDKWEDKMTVTASAFVWTDIYNKEVDKGVAVNVLKEKFGIRDNEVMVFGDYNNDIEMLKQGYHSYAMENASEEIKNVANFMAKSNNDNGVLQVIKDVVLA